MDKKLDIIRHLYGEVDDRAARRELLRDEEVAREFQAMGEAKFRLDHQHRRRPDPQVLQSIWAAAETGAPPVGAPAADRAPVARQTSARRGLLGLAGATAAAAVIALVVWWQPGSTPSSDALGPVASEDVAAFRSEAPAPMAAEAEPAWDSSVTASKTALLPASRTESTAMQWDASDDLLMLHRQIETLQQRRLDLAWDEPLQPLGASVSNGTSRTQRGLQEASQRQH